MTTETNSAPKIEKPLNIALLGYGKMGRQIHALATLQGLPSPIIIHTSRQTDHHTLVETLSHVDVCIDFSVGEALLKNIAVAIDAKKPLVIGTTGWQDQLGQLKEILKDAPIGVIYGANFALGTQLFFQMVRYASKLMRAFPLYDVSGMEWHHAAKLDSPSGTARKLTEIVLEETPHKTQPYFDRVEGALPEETLPFVSLRSGFCPGMHSIFFDGPHETIELRHTSRSRDALAQGALTAAEWIVSRKGLYTVEEMIEEMIEKGL